MNFAQRREHRYSWLVALLVLSVLLSACGGGGGASTGPVGSATLSGEVYVPEGTPRPRVMESAPLTNATVSAYLITNLNAPIAQTRTDENGRYTFSTLPREAIGKDLVVVAEKTVSGKTVRVSTLVPQVPPEGQSGVRLDAFTTLAAEEILLRAREQNWNRIAENGFASIVTRIRELLEESMSSLSLVVGETLSENLGDGLLDSPFANIVREEVLRQEGNLRLSEGPVATAKGIMRMLRDMGSGVWDVGNDENLRLEKAVREQERILNREIGEPLTALKRRGIDWSLVQLGVAEDYWYQTLMGLPPGNYKERSDGWRFVLERVGNAPDNRTWIITSEIDERKNWRLTVTVQNPIPEFSLDADAGSLTVQFRNTADTRVQYDLTLTVTQRNAQGHPTQMRALIDLRDGQLAQPVRFEGTINGVPRPNRHYSELQMNGQLTSQYGSATLQNLKLVFTAEDTPQELTAELVQLTVLASKRVSFEARNLRIRGSDERIEAASADLVSLTGANRRIILRNVSSQFFYNSVRDEDVPRQLSAQVEYHAENLVFSGQASANWENRLAETEDVVRREEFPRGSFSFRGNVQPPIGRPSGIQLVISSRPMDSTPKVTLSLSLTHGAESLEGQFEVLLRVVGGMIDMRDQTFQSGTLTMTHRPSGFIVNLTVDGNENASGTIKQPNGTVVAQIGSAQALGIPDLGDTPIVKYSDGSFETLASLLFVR